MTPTSSKIELEVLEDPDDLAQRVANWVLQLALAKTGNFVIALSGGSTPKALYRMLASPPYRDTFPWWRAHLFWGDERFVPHGDGLSNYGMAREALISKIPIPSENVHAIPTEGVTPADAARAYEEELKIFYRASVLDPVRPLFDVTFLGLGPDGHTASLFPNTAVLSERKRWVAAVIGAKAEARITLTYPALDSSRNTAFLVAGSGKQGILRRLLDNDESLPAGRLQTAGAQRAFVDLAAVGQAGLEPTKS